LEKAKIPRGPACIRLGQSISDAASVRSRHCQEVEKPTAKFPRRHYLPGLYDRPVAGKPEGAGRGDFGSIITTNAQ
jgi:hypothetical protein